mgnify:FL=1
MSQKSSMSELAKKEQRTAYKLLIPTMLILLLVAFYPLAQVFLTSFTNKRFASSQETEFVGLRNYRKLLGVTVKKMEPQINPDTGKAKVDSETGEKVYKPAYEALPSEPFLYEKLFTVGFFGNKYVVGASDADFMSAIKNTLIYTIVAVTLETIIGLIIALTVNSNFKGRGAMRAIMLVPWAVITVVSAEIWAWMLEPNRMGLFNTVGDMLGITEGQINFLGDPSLQLPSLIAVDVWKTTPFMALLILAGLQLIPQSLYEAARVDGASKVRQFFTITLPLIKPAIGVALIFRTLDTLRAFGVFQVLLGDRVYSLATYNYFQLIGNREMGLASAIGVVIFIFIAIFAYAYIQGLGVDVE